MDKDKFKNEFDKILKQKPIGTLIIVALISAFLLIAMNVFTSGNKSFISNKSNKSPETVSNADNTTDNKTLSKAEEASYEENQKIELKNILKKMNGVGDVEVMISFGNGEEKVPAYDKNTQKSVTEETDNAGGKRETNQDTDSSKVVMTQSDGANQPFILKTYKPQINGVIILAEGAENSKIKYEIQQAVSKLYNLSLDKVNVYSMKK